MTLHTVRTRVSPTVHGESDWKMLVSTRRLTSIEKPPNVFQLGSAEAHEKPLLNMPPGDETTFAAFFKVPSAAPCAIEVTVLGGWPCHRRTRYQSRASTVSWPKMNVCQHA